MIPLAGKAPQSVLKYDGSPKNGFMTLPKRRTLCRLFLLYAIPR